jgi:hypothetical protein
MISSKQLNNILKHSFSGGSGNFLAPTANFIANPSNYINAPSTVLLSGSILPNDGVNINWNVTRSNSTTPIASGSGTSVNVTLSGSGTNLEVPTAINTYGYNLNITYEDDQNSSYSTTVSTSITVSSAAKIGQLTSPSHDFTDIAGYNTLNSGSTLENGFTSKTQNQVINLFEYNATVSPSGKIVIIIPNIYGTLNDIQDNTDSSVLTQFENPISDSSNNRILYVTKNNLSPAVYHFKLIFDV